MARPSSPRGRGRSGVPRRAAGGRRTIPRSVVRRRTVAGPCPMPSSSTSSTPRPVTGCSLQAFALTGDLPASRGAVRDSFIAAWHRWPKLRRLDDPESWVRPHVLTHAQRRHTARIFHRDRKLDPELRATLDALHKLPVTSRKTLLLTQLSAASAAELGPRGRAPRRGGGAPPAEARVAFVDLRGSPPPRSGRPSRGSPSTAPTSGGHAPRSSGAPAPRDGVPMPWPVPRWSWPRWSSAGSWSPTPTASSPTLESARRPDHERSRGRHRDVAVRAVGRSPPPRCSPRRSSHAPCPAAPGGSPAPTPPARHASPASGRTFADPKASTALVRNFTRRREKGKPQLAAVQTMEFSATSPAPRRASTRRPGWFAACAMPQTQLLPYAGCRASATTPSSTRCGAGTSPR